MPMAWYPAAFGRRSGLASTAWRGGPVTSFILNGEEVEVADDHPHLLAALREELGVTSPKDGCSPSGQCGCCTVLARRQGGRGRARCR